MAWGILLSYIHLVCTHREDIPPPYTHQNIHLHHDNHPAYQSYIRLHDIHPSGDHQRGDNRHPHDIRHHGDNHHHGDNRHHEDTRRLGDNHRLHGIHFCICGRHGVCRQDKLYVE